MGAVGRAIGRGPAHPTRSNTSPTPRPRPICGYLHRPQSGPHLDDRTAITLIYQRFAPPQRTLAPLFGVTQQTIHRVIKQTRALLTVIVYTPEPTGLRLATEAEIATRSKRRRRHPG